MDTKAGRIRALNDRLRTASEGGNVVITRGLAALDAAVLGKIMIAVQCFDRFTPDNDPYGEHDCAITEVAGERVMLKSTTTIGQCKVALPMQVIQASPPAC